VDDGLPVQSQLLVHFPSLIRLAEEAGLEYLEIQNLTEFYEDYRVPFADVLKSSCDAKGTPLVDGNNRLSGSAQDVLGKCLSHALLFSPSCVFVYENGSPNVWISSEITCQLGTFLGSLRNTFQRYAHLVLHFQHNDSVYCQCTELTLAIDAALLGAYSSGYT
jgi:hypothetical protein